jgi:hypothetical protein
MRGVDVLFMVVVRMVMIVVVVMCVCTIAHGFLPP